MFDLIINVPVNFFSHVGTGPHGLHQYEAEDNV